MNLHLRIKKDNTFILLVMWRKNFHLYDQHCTSQQSCFCLTIVNEEESTELTLLDQDTDCLIGMLL
jgi:hypothetical protein